MSEVLFKGAESILYKKNGNIIKERVKKEYRIEELDSKIIKQRTKKEVNTLKKLTALGIPCPRLLKTYDNIIEMEFIDGLTVKQLDDNKRDLSEIFYKVGKLVNDVHKHNIIHGDLTTSNFIVKDQIYIIDFGLSYISCKSEDKAVDLYVFEKAIRCAHNLKYIDDFFKGYSEDTSATEVMERLEVVRMRGRKREENGV